MRGLDLSALADAKRALGVRVSVALPARNEEPTVGHIVASVRRTLVERTQLVDEVVVLDDGSTDATAEAARWEGARVTAVEDVLPDLPPGSGKGNALWKSLFVAEGDLIVWCDADVLNFGPHFVTRLLEPLLTDPEIGFVKSYYRRPLLSEPVGGGRVTELMARPLLCSLFPHLAHFVQPLSGEYAGRRALLEEVPFVMGYGVELGLLFDLAERFGLDAIVQRDLGVREHRNRPLDELAPQAMAILLTALRRAGMPASALSSTLMQFGDRRDVECELVPIEIRERPPMITVREYREKFCRELSA